jgi:hypothetical protein
MVPRGIKAFGSHAQDFEGWILQTGDGATGAAPRHNLVIAL